MEKEINVEGKWAGDINGEVYTSVRSLKHYMRKFQGFGISLEIIKDLFSKGVTTIIIVYNGKTGTKYLKSNISQWTSSTKTHNNMGNDLQYFVSECDMELI